MTAERAPPAESFLASFDLSSLTAGAARLRPKQTALIDDRGGEPEKISFAEFDRRAKALAQAWRGFGFEPGDCLLLIAGATPTSMIAIVAALRAGLELALAPAHLGAGDIAALAREARAVGLAAEPRYGEISPVETLFSVAAIASDVRLVCSLGAEQLDGAVPLDPAQLRVDTDIRLAPQETPPSIWSVDAQGAVHRHRQQTLIASAFDFAARTGIEPGHTIVSALAPASFAGLVSGPIACLLTGAALVLHGPFEAIGFLSAIRSNADIHLVISGAIAEALGDAALLHRDRIRSAILTTRCDASAPAPEQVAPILIVDDTSPEVVDLYAIGEIAAIAERRAADGLARSPAAEPHEVPLDKHELLAVRRRDDSSYEGAAVSRPDER